MRKRRGKKNTPVKSGSSAGTGVGSAATRGSVPSLGGPGIFGGAGAFSAGSSFGPTSLPTVERVNPFSGVFPAPGGVAKDLTARMFEEDSEDEEMEEGDDQRVDQELWVLRFATNAVGNSMSQAFHYLVESDVLDRYGKGVKVRGDRAPMGALMRSASRMRSRWERKRCARDWSGKSRTHSPSNPDLTGPFRFYSYLPWVNLAP